MSLGPGALSQEDIGNYLEAFFVVVVVRTGVLLASKWIEARGAVHHPPIHRTAPINK